MLRSIKPSLLDGTVHIPASKNATLRALFCAMLAKGKSIIRNPCWCSDVYTAIRIADKFGAKIEIDIDRMLVDGISSLDAIPKEQKISFSCGESATCLRNFSAIASLFDTEVEIFADKSLSNRTFSIIEEPLCSLGAKCQTNSGKPPLLIHGPIHSGKICVDAQDGTQFASGLLLAFPMVESDSELEVLHNNKVLSYPLLTTDVMRVFGADAEYIEDRNVFIVRAKPYIANNYEVEGDWSLGSIFLVAGALVGIGGLELTGLRPFSSQPERLIIDILESAGARLEITAHGYKIFSSRLNGFHADLSDCPEIFPSLVALASRCRGETVLKGLEQLNNVVPTRQKAIETAFSSMGLEIFIKDDEMHINGLGPKGRLCGTLVNTMGDFRVVMASSVAALAASGGSQIDDAETVMRSYPNFFEDLESVSMVSMH